MLSHQYYISYIKKLKKLNLIKRIGATKKGYWKINGSEIGSEESSVIGSVISSVIGSVITPEKVLEEIKKDPTLKIIEELKILNHQ